MTTITSVPTRTASHAAAPRYFGPRVDIPAAVAPAISVDDVRDLLDAAGPLTLRDIAGGLAVPARRVAGRIRQMLADCALKQDEFGRYRLTGSAAMR